jgi:hypothetical protein
MMIVNKSELEAWLCGSDLTRPTPLAIAAGLGVSTERFASALGVDVGALATPSDDLVARLRPYRLTLAVLRDVYPDDDGVWLWLRTPQHELQHARPIDLLLTGACMDVEKIVVDAWLGDSA